MGLLAMIETRKLGWGGSLRTGIFLGLLGSLALIILEAGYFALSHKHVLFNSPREYGLFLVYLTGLLLSWGVVIGFLEGTFSWLVFRLFPKGNRFRPDAFLIAAAYVFCLWYYVLARNAVLANLDHPTESHLYRQVFVLATIVCLLLLRPLYSLQKQRRRLASGGEIMRPASARARIGRLLTTAAVLVFLYWFSAAFYASRYPYIQNMFVLAIFWLGEYFFLSFSAEIPPAARRILRRIFLLFGIPAVAAALVFTLFRFDDNQNVKRIVLLETPIQVKAIEWTRRLIDFDRDGYSPILGGGDCRDRDPSINPGAYDIPGDGIDQDCFGGPRISRAGPAAPRAGPVTGVDNIILITIDAVRSDHVSCYGYHRQTTPNLDRLAAVSTRFAEAYSQSSNSIFSINSLMTSLIPLEAEKREMVQTLPEILRQAGWTTAVIAPRIRFEAYDYRHLFYRGFDHKDLSAVPPPFTDQPTTDILTEKAMEFLRREHEQPFFLWLHYYDPHAPYLSNPEAPDWGEGALDLYDGEIARADAGLGRILDYLREADLFDRSLIAVFADHGEEFGEHEGKSHGPTLYNEVLRVPLIIRIPVAEAGIVTTRVGLLDLPPTVLDALGLAFPDRIQGLSLLPAILGLEIPEREEGIFAENLIHRKRSLIYGDWKLIYDYRYVIFELYNLAEDPGETRNIFDREPGIAADMVTRLAVYY